MLAKNEVNNPNELIIKPVISRESVFISTIAK